ncbi:m11 protein [Murid betaherpesvirus 1]|nr:m11 protein [Murid betaherpesvirus 1]AWV68265.1 m11 protein [Murid betaherpesvirus 1]
MAHHYLGRSLFILAIYFAVLSMSRVTPAARAPAPKTNNCTKFSYPGVDPGFCTENRAMTKITTFKNGTKVYSCPLQTVCVNARLSGIWCVNNSAFGSLFFTSTSTSPPKFQGLTGTPRPRPGLWLNPGNGYLYVFSNATKKPEKEIYCTLTVCITAITTRRPTTTRSSKGVSTGISTTGLWTDETSVVSFPFGSADENFGVSASPQTASSGTIAAIVIVIAICVGLVVLAVLYYRGYIGHSRRLNLYRERLHARFLVSQNRYPTSYSTRYPSTYTEHHDPSDPTFFLPPLHISTSAA